VVQSPDTNADEVIDSSLACTQVADELELTKEGPREERKEQTYKPKFSTICPPFLRPTRDTSDAELEMQTGWMAKQIKYNDPERYAAAIDPEKRQAYPDSEAYRQEEILDATPLCTFVKSGGETCGFFSMKKKRFCYSHEKTSDGRKKKKNKETLTSSRAGGRSCDSDGGYERMPRPRRRDSRPKKGSHLAYGLQVVTAAVRRNAGRKAAETAE